MQTKKKIAIVYDWIDSWGGVERILLLLHDIYPEADFYSSYIDRKHTPWADQISVKTSFIQSVPSFIKRKRIFSLPLYLYAFEQFDFSEYDVVISITSAFAKSIITKPSTKHICYLLTPPRYVWSMNDTYIKNRFVRMMAAPYIYTLRAFDYITAQRPDMYLFISNTIARRAKKYYGVKGKVMYPPFDVSYWNELLKKNKNTISSQLPDKPYYLVVSRLESYKKVDLAIRTFNKLSDKTLVIVGKGTLKHTLQAMAGKNIYFRENLSDTDLVHLYTHAKALIMPQEEDFGYVALEAQTCGCPVIAFGKGGATETVKDEKTAIFFEEQTTTSLQRALERFEKMTYNGGENKLALHIDLAPFSQERFITQFQEIIEENV